MENKDEDQDKPVNIKNVAEGIGRMAGVLTVATVVGTTFWVWGPLILLEQAITGKTEVTERICEKTLPTILEVGAQLGGIILSSALGSNLRDGLGD